MKVDQMNSLHSNSKAASWRWAKWLMPLVSLPILIMMLVAGWLWLREAKAANEIDVLIAPIREAGQPLGDAWLEQYFRAHTSTEGTAAWSEILMLTSVSYGWASANDLPIIGSGKLQPLLDPAQEWPANDRVGEYLAEMRPVIDLIHDSTDCPKPVWQPMVFNGFWTLLPELQESRGILRLLQLEAEHALYHREPARALAAIRSMQATAEVFDWDLCMIGELVHIAHLGMLDRTITRSLQVDEWNADQIDQLMRLVEAPLPVSEKWRAMFRSEKAFALSSLDSNQSLGLEVDMLATRGAKLQLLKMYQELEDLADGSVHELNQRVAAFDAKLQAKIPMDSSLVMVGQFLPSAAAIARAFERAQDMQQLVFIALAVKKYQLTEEQWPSELDDLAKLGLKIEDWTIPGVGSLGYAVEDNTAYLWSAYEKSENDYRRTTVIASQRPQFALDELDDYFHVSIVK